jgi:hypothetical protein
MLSVGLFLLAVEFLLSQFLDDTRAAVRCSAKYAKYFGLVQRIAICVTFFFIAQFAKALCCRLLALRIHAEAHFDRLEVRCHCHWQCHALLRHLACTHAVTHQSPGKVSRLLPTDNPARALFFLVILASCFMYFTPKMLSFGVASCYDGPCFVI